jgi:drug/metabolite transporter (DMT)-like permease
MAAALATTTKGATVVAIALALMASLGWGTSDFLGGLRTRSLPLRAVVTGMMAGGLLTAALVTLARGSGYPGGILVAGVIAGLSSMVAVSSLYKALAIGSMSIVAPVSAAYPIVPVVYGLAHGERPSWLQFAGMALIVVGVIVASYVRDATGDGLDPAQFDPRAPHGDERHVGVVPLPDVGEGLVGRVRRDASSHRPRTLASLVLAVVAALASGTVLTALSSAADTDPYWAMIVMRGVALMGMLAVVVVGRSGFGARPAQVPLLLGIGALDTVATGLFAIATTFGYLSVVSVIASLFPLGTIALARLALGEHLHRHQNVGVAAALVGVALVALG